MSLSIKDTQMKSTLGKFFIIFMAFTYALNANTKQATFELTAQKKSLVVKEALEVKFVTHQSNHDDVMFFFLEPKKSDDYKIILLNKVAKDLAYHDKEAIFTYLVFPLKSGEISVDFKFTIKVASDEAVAQVYQGSRDNVKWIETINTDVFLEPIKLEVKELDQKVDLVGDFTLSATLAKENIFAYESANISYTLNGTGFNNFSFEPIEALKNVELFKDVTKHYDKATPSGYELHREFNYALVSSHDIYVKAKKFNCYSPKLQQYYTLQTQNYIVKVQNFDKTQLLDEENYPQTNSNFKFIGDFFTYLLVFLSGYLTAKYMPTSYFEKYKKFQDIKNAKNAKDLLYVLMHSYDKYDFKEHYEALNEIVYYNGKKSEFKKIKKSILKYITTIKK